MWAATVLLCHEQLADLLWVFLPCFVKQSLLLNNGSLQLVQAIPLPPCFLSSGHGQEHVSWAVSGILEWVLSQRRKSCEYLVLFCFLWIENVNKSSLLVLAFHWHVHGLSWNHDCQIVPDIRTEEKKNNRPRGRRMVWDVACNTQPKLRISYGGHWAPPPDLDAEVKARRYKLAHVLDRTPYVTEADRDVKIASQIDRRQEQEVHTLWRIPAREQAEHAGIVTSVPTPGYWPPENIWSSHRFDGFKPPPILGDPRYHDRTSAAKEHLGIQQGIKPPEKDPDDIPYVWNPHPDNYYDLRNTADPEKHYASLRLQPLPPVHKAGETWQPAISAATPLETLAPAPMNPNVPSAWQEMSWEPQVPTILTNYVTNNTMQLQSFTKRWTWQNVRELAGVLMA